MKPFARMILVSSLAFAAAVGNDVYAEVEKSSDITWYSPVGVSFMDNAYPWVGRYGGHGDKLDNPGVIGLGVNFLLGECGEMNGLLLNLGAKHITMINSKGAMYEGMDMSRINRVLTSIVTDRRWRV